MSAGQVESALHSCHLPWEHRAEGKESLFRHFEFSDFTSAFGVMTVVGQVAEEMGHHPDWYNVYNQVKVNLNTHDVQGITQKDFALAMVMEHVASQTAIELSQLSVTHPLWPQQQEILVKAINAHL